MKTQSGYFLSVLMGIAVLIFVFQNCSSPVHIAQQEAGSLDLNAITYPYLEKQIFYVNATLLAEEASVQSLSQFKVAASIAYPDAPEESIAYSVSVKTLDGGVACPTQSGSLSAGKSLIKFDCTSTVANESLKITVSASAAGNNSDFDFLF